MKSYILQNAYALWVGAAAVIGGVSFWAFPAVARDTSIVASVGWLANGWNVLYLLGGLLSVMGIFYRSPRLELVGISLLGPAMFINGVAIILVHGQAGIINGIVVLGLAAANLVRTIVLWVAYQIDRGVGDACSE